MALTDGNDTQGTLLGLQAEPLPLPGLAPPARKYQALMELGRGGSAVVSAALARGIGGFTKLVVLKTTKEELCGHAEAVRASLNEARLAARMSHPNIVQVYEVYQDQGVPVIVMEYLDGLSLSRVARQGNHASGPPLQIALTVLCKVLEGIRYAHGLADFDGKPLGIVHRDISPQNVMLTYDGQVKLVDFGTAKLMAGGEQSLSGMLRGKLGYMPPEQVCAEDVDGRVDVFAVGVMLWEAIAGRRLWGELNHAGIIRRLMEHDIPRLSDAVPGVDAELERICSRALAPQRDDRYPNASEFSSDLERYLAAIGGSVPAAALGEMVQHSCADLKRAREEALRAALAQLEDWQMDDADGYLEATHTMLTMDGPIELPPPVPSGRSRRYNLLWGALLFGGLSCGLLLARYAVFTPRSTEAAAPAPLVASVALAAPSHAARPPSTVLISEEPMAFVEPRAPRLRVPKSSKASRRSSAAPKHRSPTRSASPVQKPNPCDPPYSIDERGIKRFHRDCLTGKR